MDDGPLRAKRDHLRVRSATKSLESIKIARIQLQRGDRNCPLADANNESSAANPREREGDGGSLCSRATAGAGSSPKSGNEINAEGHQPRSSLSRRQTLSSG